LNPGRQSVEAKHFIIYFLMDILHISPTYYPATYWGGPIFSVYALNNALAAISGVSLAVVSTDSAGPQRHQRLENPASEAHFPGQTVHFFRRVAGVSVSLSLLACLPGFIRRADVVHLTAAYSFPTVPTLLLCRILRKPLVWSPRGAILDASQWQGSRRPWLKSLWNKACNLLARPGRVRLHTTSEGERVASQRAISRAQAFVLPNGVAVPNGLPTRVWQPNGVLRLIYLGRLSPKKGLENLIQAMALLKGQAINLTVYGTGEPAYMATLVSLARQVGLLDQQVVFRGHVDGQAKQQAFCEADLCVVPSHTENFCMVVAEALAHGVPVIASTGTPWAELEPQQCGCWVDNAPSSLVAAIQSMRGQNLPAWGARGRRWMQQQFDWGTVAQGMHRVYGEMLAREGARHG